MERRHKEPGGGVYIGGEIYVILYPRGKIFMFLRFAVSVPREFDRHHTGKPTNEFSRGAATAQELSFVSKSENGL